MCADLSWGGGGQGVQTPLPFPAKFKFLLIYILKLPKICLGYPNPPDKLKYLLDPLCLLGVILWSSFPANQQMQCKSNYNQQKTCFWHVIFDIQFPWFWLNKGTLPNWKIKQSQFSSNIQFPLVSKGKHLTWHLICFLFIFSNTQ